MLQVIDQLARTRAPRIARRRLGLGGRQRAPCWSRRPPRPAPIPMRRSTRWRRSAPRSRRRSRDAGAPGAHRVQLRMSGPGVFAVPARAEDKARRGAPVHRQQRTGHHRCCSRCIGRCPALLLGLLPVATGALVGVAAVALGFRRRARHHAGIRHHFDRRVGGLLDLLLHPVAAAAPRGASPRWRQRLWPTMRLGMLTSVCGFASLLPSGFPGLAQLGAYSISGLIAAAAGDALRPARAAARADSRFAISRRSDCASARLLRRCAA